MIDRILGVHFMCFRCCCCCCIFSAFYFSVCVNFNFVYNTVLCVFLFSFFLSFLNSNVCCLSLAHSVYRFLPSSTVHLHVTLTKKEIKCNSFFCRSSFTCKKNYKIQNPKKKKHFFLLFCSFASRWDTQNMYTARNGWRGDESGDRERSL